MANDLTVPEETKPQTLAEVQLWAKEKGNRHKINQYKFKKILKFLKQGHTIKDTCSLVYISEPTFYRFLNRNESLVSQIEEAMVFFKARHLTNVNKASRTDAKHSEWLLERIFPNQFAPKSMLAVQSKGELRIVITPSGYNPNKDNL